MQLGMNGLGRMGTDRVRRLIQKKHDCVVYDLHAEAIKHLQDQGGMGASSLEDWVARPATPRMGLNILRNADAGKRTTESDAETTPLRNPEYYQYELDLSEIAEVWRRGSVIGSWLLDLTAAALLTPGLKDYAGRVSDSGEGRWTVAAAIDEAVPAPILSTALYERFSSRGDADVANRVLSAMRHGFGGHVEQTADKQG